MALLAGAAMLVAACGPSTTPSAGAAGGASGDSTPTGSPRPTTTLAVTAPPPTTASSTTSTTTAPGSTSTTSTSPSTTTSSTTSPTTSSTIRVEPLPDPALPATNAAFDALAAGNPAVSMTVLRDGVPVFRRATGTTVDGAAATTDSPMVVASVSKLLTAGAVARLAGVGLVDLAGPVPWDRLGIAPHPGWHDVTVRELLDHTSGMPVARRMWFDGMGTCANTLPFLVADPPADHRGKWTYSNGNYCALGLLVEAVTGRSLVVAVNGLLTAPVAARGVHLTTDGVLPGDVPYALGVERLSRLGGAGSFLVSTDTIAAVLASITPSDRLTMTWPGVMIDQYGWGHTGTVDGAKACAWVLEGGRTIVVTTVSGDRPGTGGGVCDLTVQAIAGDLGIGAGEPERSPV